MKKLYVAFVWHMHQPLYKDQLAERYYLPWVRLHSLKGYYDLPALLEKFPGIKQTFNLTPSLLYQLNDYTRNANITDDFLEITLKPASLLTAEDKEFILSNFFMNNWNTVVKPHHRYSELLNKRGLYSSPDEIRRRTSRFEDQEFLDLQVLLNLTWFGFSLRKREARLQELIRKGMNYTEAEKREVIDFQFKAMSEIIPLYKKLASRGQIELTTTPYYHPILPLIYDRSLGYAYRWQEDARWQVHEGLRYFEECFGWKPNGLWPSEGSVSQDIIPLLADEGVRWIASDEEILFRSVTEQDGREAVWSSLGRREDVLYQPYQVQDNGQSVAAIFRDHKISDLIGFSYAGSEFHAAVDDFMKRLRGVRETLINSPDDHLVSVILDGENAWEYYQHGGERFLTHLYEKLSDDPAFETVTVSDYLERFPPRRGIKRLHPGSWINHDFRIWYGHEEDRLAWDYLAKTREFLLSDRTAPAAVKERAWREIYAAEGSDWYWWYGDEFTNATEDVFDFLFRNHLMNVYRLLDKRYPAYLKKPIKQFNKPKRLQEPAALISPVLDGKLTTFYEWANAGLYKVEEPSEAMHKTERLVSEIHYGFNLEAFFVRVDFFDGVARDELRNARAVLNIHCDADFEISFKLENGSPLECHRFQGERKEKVSELRDSFRLDKILEIRVPFDLMDLKRGREVQFTFAIDGVGGIRLEEWPRHGIIAFSVPDETFESLMWSV